MKLKSIIFVILLLTLTASSARLAVGQAPAGPVIVMPFENVSNDENPKYNWLGEGFAVLLPELFEVCGVSAISNSDRRFFQQRLKIPASSLPSLAAAIKIARENGAKLLVTGTFEVVPGRNEGAETIIASARIIDLASAKVIGQKDDPLTSAGGAGQAGSTGTNAGTGSLKGEIWREEVGSRNLGSLASELAFLLLMKLGSREAARPTLAIVANRVPPESFEAFVKGVSASDSETRVKEGYFKRAVDIYASQKESKIYNDAALELGHLYLKQSKIEDALDYFSRVAPAPLTAPEPFTTIDPKTQGLSAEASFYMSSIYWRQGKSVEALDLLRPLVERFGSPVVRTQYGGIAVHAGRTDKTGRSDEFLKQGLESLRLAVGTSPENRDALFNLGLALFIRGDYQGAFVELRKFLDVGIGVNKGLLPSDGDAQFLLAKSMAEIPGADPAAVTREDDRAKELLKIDNRYGKLRSAWDKQRSVDMIAVRVRFVDRSEFRSLAIRSARAMGQQSQTPTEIDLLIAKAKDLFNANQDTEANDLLRRVMKADPTIAEVWYLSGMIALRKWRMDKAGRNEDVDKAIRDLRTATFWKKAYFEPYEQLIKIHVERKQCVEAGQYLSQYLGLANDNVPERRELESLKRLVNLCPTR